ncbi:hypothetical protein MKW92_014980 [Papaver armeniacum]|nr:hypothetical protein MKW92_014980 [Papaver armeniacum]
MAVEMDEELTVDLFLGHRFSCDANSRLYHEYIMISMLRLKFSREVSLLSHLHHQNIIEVINPCFLLTLLFLFIRNPSVFCIITEYLGGGFVKSHYLKPENLIFDEDNQVKFVGLEIACKEASCDSLADDAGTYRWMASEMIKLKSHWGNVHMVAGTIPFDDKTPIQEDFAGVNKVCLPAMAIFFFFFLIALTGIKRLSTSLRDLMEHCWTSAPEKKPESWKIVKVLEKGLLHWIHKLGHHHSHHSNHVNSLL